MSSGKIWRGGLAAAAGVAALVAAAGFTGLAGAGEQGGPRPAVGTASAAAATVDVRTRFRTETIDGLEIFYREAGPKDGPVVLLLHGFPTSSHMYRDLIGQLSDKYRVIAPDFPGYGLSSSPSVGEWDYTFDNIATVVEKLLDRIGVDAFTVYVMDYGAPVGYRLMERRPERIEGLIVQNGNAYDEGLDNPFWAPIKQYWAKPGDKEIEAGLSAFLTIDGTKWQYLTGVREPEVISPDNWLVTQPLLDRPGNREVQLKLFLDYGSNPGRYPAWQRIFRERQYPTLIVWGKNDQIFPAAGATPYLRDLPKAELHLLDTGHFALEEDGAVMGGLIREWLGRVYPGR